MIIHLTRPAVRDEHPSRNCGTWCDDTREFNGPAALPLFCLAPHGVFPPSRITPRAVSSYLAFSPLPALLSKNRRCVFCDTFRQRPLSRMLPAYFTRHAAVWCSDFPPANRKRFTSDHLPSQTTYHNKESRKAGSVCGPISARLPLLKIRSRQRLGNASRIALQENLESRNHGLFIAISLRRLCASWMVSPKVDVPAVRPTVSISSNHSERSSSGCSM